MSACNPGLLTAGHTEKLTTRADILKRKTQLRGEVSDLSKEAKTYAASSPERSHLYRSIQARIDEQAQLEQELEASFVPQHGPRQLISPRAFFVSPLFRVCSKRVERAREVSLEMKNSLGSILFKYQGPELRQSDGFVFMALLSLARDHRAGSSVSFNAEEVCRQVFSRYDGPARQQLKDHIKRLQRGLLEFEQFSVQLCSRFDFPSRGPWKVSIDSDIVQLFKRSAEVWLDLPLRQAFPEGLCTWLYAYIESQTKLIPTPTERIRELCGSEASEESFPRTLRIALKELAEKGIVDDGWHITKGMLHWRKATTAPLLPAPSEEVLEGALV
ncbi:hypothetical protein LC612_30145 [Nostoc sp. CHAB 5834]|nr:hypothetical protein [Nostoc sp. CHAB 5834]